MSGPHPALIELAAGRRLPPVTDPTPLLRSAVAHGMTGLLLSEIEKSDVPWRRIARTVLNARQAPVLVWHKRLWEALSSVSRVLEDVGADVAIAKGIAAEARWYSRMGERPCSDLDLVLSPAHLSKVDDIIAAIEPSHPLCGKVRGFAERGLLQSVDIEYEGVPIDLHWDILKFGIPSRNRQAIWDRTVPFELPGGRFIRALDAECSYVHFLLHLNKDRFRRLMCFVDVARIHEREHLDRGVIDQLVRADGIETSVYASWDVVVDTLGLPASRTNRASIRSFIWHVAWPSSVRLRSAESKIRFRHRQWLIAFLSRGRAAEATRGWLRSTFPPGDLLAYAHSDYARRWGGEPISNPRRSRLWALTLGRIKLSLGRRRRAARAARLVRGAETGPRRRYL